VAERAPISRAGLAIGLGLLAVAGVIVADTARLQVPPSYARIGPQVFPFAIAACLAAIGIYLAWSSWAASGRRDITSEDQPTDWPALCLILAGLLVHLLLLKTLGFILVSAGLFVIVSVAFGSRLYLRDAAIGLILAAVTYLGFTRLLGLQLPPGLFAGLI
jgi:putative tricarboxylic transport membrane protein